MSAMNETFPLSAAGHDSPLTLDFDYVPAVNLAFQQNDQPIVRKLEIANASEKPLRDLVCVVSAEPEFISRAEIPVASIDAGESVAVLEPKISLNYAFLATLSDAAAGTLSVEIRDGNGNALLRENFPAAAYSPDQWLGKDAIPELLAAFVTPNLEVVTGLMSRVADELEHATGDAAIQGYQADRKRVYEICAAIYRAVASLGIRYSNPPSSFGSPGQRIRFADTVCRYRLGTCLDLSLLFASVMEQCMLHPAIIFHKGHAYVGCHLKKNYFPDVPMDDLQTLRKLTELDEFLVFETTMVCSGESFSEAETYARSRHLNVGDDFEFAVDVVRARHSGIFPLPLLRSVGGIEFEETAPKPPATTEEAARKIREEIDLESLAAETPRDSGRAERWRQNLLDLSLRNRLLNSRDDRCAVPLTCADVTKLEDKMAANETLSIAPLSKLLGEKDLLALESHRATELETEIRDLLATELEQKRLRSLLPENELKKRLTELYRRSRTDLEESGVNTVFLAVGFLEWKTAPEDERSFLAPILLMPVRLHRRSPAENPRVSRIDEDTIVNAALLELLRREHGIEIPGLNPLPCDGSGTDVARVLGIFRRATLNMRGWEVREEARIGHFSFGKFLMWNDLRKHADAFAAHPIVGHLVGGNGVFDDGVSAFPPEEVGRRLDPAKLFCPMNADSSQLAAVLYSEAGKNFVLHGPPGTGKSQTITNIIAHNLALGRRVLFVSEKKAALDVVRSRLDAVGLRPFCLELHSDKAGKADVLKQFAESLEVADRDEPDAWAANVNALERSRAELNAYVAALHRPYPNGLSAHACFSRIFEKGAEAEAAEKLDADCLSHTEADLNEFRETAKTLAEAFASTSGRGRKAFRALAPAEWSPGFERTLGEKATRLADAAEKLDAAQNAFTKTLGLGDDLPPEKSDALRALARILREPEHVPAGFLSDAFPQTEKFVRATLDEISRRDALAEKLSPFRLDAVADLDFGTTERRVEEIRGKFALLRPFAARGFLRGLSGLKKSGGALSLDELSGALETMRLWRESRDACAKARARAERIFGGLWNDGAPARERTESALGRAKKMRELADKIEDAGTPGHAGLFERLSRAGTEKTAAALADAHEDFSALLADFSRNFAPTLADENATPRGLAAELRLIPENLDELRRALLYLERREAAERAGAGTLIRALERGDVSAEDFRERAETAYRRTMLEGVLDAEPRLRRFIGEKHEAEIRRFREADARYLALSRELVFARLAERVARARADSKNCGTALGLLRRECEKRARHKPVRQLLEQIRPLVPALKPCFLMSPLSVAQYLTTDASAAFDLVVFDEASQIPVWDAVGAILRGKQLIVVGDPKQMPPTDFFRKKTEESDGDETEDEQPENAAAGDEPESILDECIAAGIFSAHLTWHYRSRCESLIAFSNRRYYDDRLTTFPAARKSPELGVRFEFVPDGVYDRQGRRTNRREAEALVAFIFRRLADPAMRKKSMGVVTFSLPQRDLIEDILERERVKHPELDEYFGDGNAENFFVKNLENVQGDERDAILFSVGYARDARGTTSMNFGPLNRQGGERRLNVAVTRAKEQIVVFSSMHGSQIDLSRTQAVGAAHLKYFLDYAEKGLRLLPAVGGRAAKATETDGVADSVAAFLESRGYAVKRDVGNSDLRVDVAVSAPERPDEFLLGIECDGNAYRDQRTARDRDHLRDSVLESLGWKIFRLWTPAWAFDRSRTEAALLKALSAR